MGHTVCSVLVLLMDLIEPEPSYPDKPLLFSLLSFPRCFKKL